MTKNEFDLNSEMTVGDVCRVTQRITQAIAELPPGADPVLTSGASVLEGETTAEDIAAITAQPAATLDKAVEFIEALVQQAAEDNQQPHEDIVAMINSLMQLGFGQVYRAATATDRN
jgi:hypothetical protein